MSNIQIKERSFKPYMSQTEIEGIVRRMAQQMSVDLKDKYPLFICVLNGSFMFAADLMKEVSIPSEITFMRMKSYCGTATTGKVKVIQGLEEDIAGRTVVVLEDIVDSGYTINRIKELLVALHPAEVITATLLYKPEALKTPVQLDYVGKRIPNDFIVGYGLDYNEEGRNLKEIYVINE